MTKKQITLFIEIILFIGTLCAITGVYYMTGNKEELEEESIEVGIIKVNDENYEEEVKKSEKPVILEFSSNNCPPCLTMIPTMIDIAKNHKEIKVCSVNSEADNTTNMVNEYMIDAFPTIFIIKNGEVVKKFVGATSEEDLLAPLEEGK